MSVREYGRVVLMGGVGMLGGEDLALPYPWLMRNSVTVRGQWMYPRTANVGMIRLVASGTLDLEHDQVTSFTLDEANEAVAHAAAHPGPFDRTVLTPASHRPEPACERAGHGLGRGRGVFAALGSSPSTSTP
jgi:alcohol dehydrogenase